MKSNLSGRSDSNDHVTVSIPYFKCKPYVRKAVESILDQSHTNLSLVVINDGDPDSPWAEVSDIDDPRLFRFDLQSNYGKFFADQMVLEATTAEYFLVQDADDWSHPDRIASLLEKLKTDNADGVTSARWKFKLINGRIVKTKIERTPYFNRPLTPRLVHRAYYQGLFRTAALREIGGWYGGFRICYNTFVMNLLIMTGKISYVDSPLYHYLVRPESSVIRWRLVLGLLKERK